MGSVELMCYLQKPTVQKTLNVDGVKFVSDLRHQVSCIFQIDPDSFDLLHLGCHMRDDQLIADLIFDDHNVIYVLNSSQNLPPEKVTVDEETFTAAVSSLKKILGNKSTRNTVDKKLQHQKIIECIIKAVPEFGRDPIAISIVTSKDLLWSFLTKSGTMWDRITSEHPSLTRAVMFLVEALKSDQENIDKSSKTQKSEYQDTRTLYNIDHMSDDDDDEDDDELDHFGREGRGRREPTREMQGSFPRLFPYPYLMSQMGQTSNQGEQPSSSGTQPLITADYFRQAMMLATNGTNMPQWTPDNHQLQSDGTSAVGTQSSAQEDIESKLQQLREMGITDEDTARRVLQETSGNLQLALEILFGNEF